MVLRVPPATRRAVTVATLVVAAFTAASCRSVLSAKYEYDEEIYLALDGSATVYVNASVPALVALRDAPLDVDPRARLDRADVRQFFESPVTDVVNVSTSRRDNRRYVHVRMEVSDITRLGEAPAFAWSTYSLTPAEERVIFRQEVGPSAGREVGDVGWTGGELVAFRLHLPSRVPFHNAQGREIERGNIIRWEQPLAARRAGQPLSIEVHMDADSILFQTLTLFGVTIVLALLTLAAGIWFVMRRRGAPLGAPPGPQTAKPPDHPVH